MQILQYKKTENGKVNKDINVYNVIMYLRIREDSKQLSQNHYGINTYEKQTYSSLAKKFGLSTRTIQRKIDEIQINNSVVKSGDAVIIMDTSYFRRNFGVMVFRDHYRKKNVFWQYLKYETIAEYKLGIKHLESIGWNILGIVCDGKRGIFSSFGNIPVQMCQHHQVEIIRRYITKNPRLEAGKEMRKISLLLTKSGKEDFISILDQWYQKWKSFLMEKTYNEKTGKWHYTHRRLRSAYRSLKTNMPNLFICDDYPDLNIPNTTNSLEGVFSNLKTKLRVHSGMKNKRKINLINELLGK